VATKRLWLHRGPEGSSLTTDDFLWRNAAQGQSSFWTSIDPEMAQLGKVARANQDMVSLAVLAFLADRTTPRPQAWGRELELHLPVYAVDRWKNAGAAVERMLSYLSGDEWSVQFDRRGPTQLSSHSREKVDLVCLFSGGADSLCGAVRALADGKRLVLLSHWDWGPHSGIQRKLAREFERVFEIEIPYIQVRMGRRKAQLGGSEFPDEATRRSRSLLFIALGLAAGSDGSTPLWVPENGYASINPPLAPERRGSLSTRTTHPTFFALLGDVLTHVGAHSDFVNPFRDSTKGEMFGEISEAVGKAKAQKLLALTHSCVHVRWAGMFNLAPETQCGVCFGCLVRRAAFRRQG
jgi:7-cyano-7-deazaguanine synthase in queuosine biosynthesis